jgi:S1-C subfamily serine protease
MTFVEGLIDSTVQVWASCPDGSSGSGSGVVISQTDTASLIATAAHVAESATCVIKVDEKACYLQKINVEDDTAIISCAPSARRPRALVSPVLGEPVWVVGYPFQLHRNKTHLQVTTGNISAVFDDRFKYSAPSYFGNSGGPIFNAKGQVVGLVVLLYSAGRNPWGKIIPMPGEYFGTSASKLLDLWALKENLLTGDESTVYGRPTLGL